MRDVALKVVEELLYRREGVAALLVADMPICR
jgi:hypothetical protein